MVTRRDFSKSLLFAAISSLVFTYLPRETRADIPDIQKIEDRTTCSTACKINVQIRHSNPSDTHYIDFIEVEVDDQISKYDLEPQGSDPFTVDLNLSSQRRNPEVRARGHCTLHGWGNWSNLIQLPEFPSLTLAVFGALAISMFILRKKTKRRETVKRAR